MIIMANKRSLKHAINLICEELFAEAVAASLYGNNPKAGNADDVLTSIIRLQTDYISRISHVEPGMEARKYFRVLREEQLPDEEGVVLLATWSYFPQSWRHTRLPSEAQQHDRLDG